MLIQKYKIKKILKDEDCRLSPESWDGINRAVESLIKGMANNVKADGMKTLMAKHTVVSKKTKVAKTTKCTRCCNIKDEFVRFAKNTQDYCHEQAVVLSRRV